MGVGKTFNFVCGVLKSFLSLMVSPIISYGNPQSKPSKPKALNPKAPNPKVLN